MDTLIQAKLIEGVAKAIDKFSQPAVYQQVKVGAYDITSGTASESVKKININAVFSKIKETQMTLAATVNGTQIATISTSGMGFVPELNDRIVRGKDTFTIVNIESDSVGAAYRLMLRAN